MSHERELIEIVEELVHTEVTEARLDEIENRLAEIKAAPKPGVVPAQMSARATVASMVLDGCFSRTEYNGNMDPVAAAAHAVQLADALLEALGEESK